MAYSVIREGETLAGLALRLAVPPCMLLRANGLFAPGWLLPGREILVPNADFCARQPAFVCPTAALRLPSWPADAKTLPLSDFPRRLNLLARSRTLIVPVQAATVVVHYGDSWESVARRFHSAPEVLMRLNRYWGPLLPGMRLAIEIP